MRDTKRIVRMRPSRRADEDGLLIVETLSGQIHANAGVDESNAGGAGLAISLPIDADASARAIRQQLLALCKVNVGIIISDTFGRPWRMGEANVSIGQAGVPATVDLRGSIDRDGRVLRVSQPAFADEVAVASGLVSGKAGGFPVSLVRGVDWQPREQTSRDLLRSDQENLFT